MHGTPCHTDTAAAMRALANKYRIAYAETATDILGHQITRLAGDDVALDDTVLLLLALERAGHVSPTDAVRLHADYLHQIKP